MGIGLYSPMLIPISLGSLRFFLTKLVLIRVVIFPHSFSCNVIVKLPIASSTLLPAVGYLQAPLNSVKVVPSMVGVTSVYETGLFKLCFHYYAIDVN